MGGQGADTGCTSTSGSLALPDYTNNLAVDGVALLVALIVLALLTLLALAVRRGALLRGNGGIECSLRHHSAALGEWILGVARYDGEVLHWYRVFSLSGRPADTVSRRGLTVRGRRTPSDSETLAVAPGAVVVELWDGRRTLELAMGEGAFTGFLAWLESAPPSAHIDHIT